MDDSARVRCGERVERVLCDRERHGHRQGTPQVVCDRLDGRPIEQIHHQECGAVLRHVVVDDADDPRVAHGVCRVAFLLEPPADRLPGAQLGMEDLDGEPRRVAVLRLVDRTHATDAEHALEPVLATHDRAEPRVGTRLELVVGGGHTARVTLRAQLDDV